MLGVAPRDQRLAGALAQALALRWTLGASGTAPSVKIDYRILDTAGDNYQVDYLVDGQSRQVALSSLPSRSGDNLTALHDALVAMAPAMSVSGAAMTTAVKLAIPFDSQDLLRRLAAIDVALAADPLPSRLMEAAELYAWQGFFKTGASGSSLSDVLATRALACYLAAGTSDRFVEGLIWLALNLPTAARTAFEQAPASDRRQAFMAYLARDFAGLRALHADSPEDRGFVAYLLARAAQESELGTEADVLVKRLVTTHADFAPALEYVVSAQIVGVSNPYMWRYPLALAKTHLEILGELVPNAVLTASPELAASAYREPGTEHELAGWLRLHAGTLKRPLADGPHGLLLDIEQVKRILLLEMQDALYHLFMFEKHSLSRLQESGIVAHLISDIYPGSSLARTVWLWMNATGRAPEEVLRYQATVGLGDADARLLATYLWMVRLDSKIQQFPKLLDALGRLRQLSSPSRDDLLQLADHYQRIYFRDFAIASLHLAMAAAPDDYSPARTAFALRLMPQDRVLAGQLERIAHLPSALALRARIRRDAGDQDEAVALFRRAIVANPTDEKSYTDLADILVKTGEKQAAVEILRQYLEHDRTTSLQAATIRNWIGHLELGQGHLQAAYETFEVAAGSGMLSSYLGLAQASEALGRHAQAEALYRHAAERYPQSRAGAELACFHLRRSERAAAIQTLRTYRNFNTPDYYVKALAGYAVNVGRPKLAVEIAREVSAEDWQGIRVRYFLAQALSELDENETAAELYSAMARDVVDPKHSSPYTYAPPYLKASEAIHPGSTGSLLRELIGLYSGLHPMVMEYFGLALYDLDMYAPATTVFLARIPLARQRADISVLLAALAWRKAGENDAEQKGRILEKLDDFQDDWLATRVHFLLKELDGASLLAEATDRSRLCEAHYFLGLDALGRGERGLAQRHLITSLQSRAINYMEYKFSYDLLRELDKQPETAAGIDQAEAPDARVSTGIDALESPTTGNAD